MSPYVRRCLAAQSEAGRAPASTPVDGTLGDRVPADNRHEHSWWHATGIHRHLVCMTCGEGLHDIAPGTHPTHEAGIPLAPCNIH